MQNKIILLALVATASAFANAGDFYSVRESTDELVKVNVTTGATTTVGSLGVNFNFGDLAFDTSSNTMYMSSGRDQGNGSSLYTVNLTTGAATLVGAMGQVEMFGLAYDPTSGKLYGSQSTGAQGFFDINKSTGLASAIQTGQGVNLDGITYVGSTKAITGIFAGPGSIYTVDPGSGNYTLVSNGGGFVDNCGVAWDASNNMMYSVDWSGALYSFDVANGYNRTFIASMGQSYDGLAYTGVVPEPTMMLAAAAGLAAMVRKRKK